MSQQPRLSARGLCFQYRGGAGAVEDWTAHFAPGEVVAVTGPSGCGKSTRLYLLGLMLRLQAGRVEVDGRRVDNLSDAARAKVRARQFGFVFQDAALDPTRTVLDNVIETVLYSGADRGKATLRAHQLLETMNVAVPPNRRPGQVSGGQAQRIAICRALVGRPGVVIADEPTGNLDAESAKAVLGMLRGHASGGATVVLVTHDLHIAQTCDRRIDLRAASAHG